MAKRTKGEEKLSIAEVLKNLDKKYSNSSPVERFIVPTGSIALDKAIGGGYVSGRITEYIAWEGVGKAQPLYSKILTPTGWIEMKDVEVGTIVSTPDGKDSTIIGIFPQGMQDIYRITFDDKTFTDCTLDHLWKVRTRQTDQEQVLSVKEILTIGLKKKSGCRNFSIPTVEPIKLSQYGKITIDPYLLGLLLGDGCFTQDSIKISTADEDILLNIKEILSKNYNNTCLSRKQGKYDYNFRKIKNGNSKTEIFKEIKELGLINLYSHEKFIPKEYLFTSIENRIAILQGLLDSDGTVSNCSISFSTSSKKLSENFEFLVRSLGARCTTSTKKTSYGGRIKKEGKLSYRSNVLLNTLQFKPFKLNRKLVKFNISKSPFKEKYIEKIEKVGEEKAQCIAIGHPERLYITDDFIVTHNTTAALHAVKEIQDMGKIAAYIDAEHALDRKYAEAIGVNWEELVLVQPSFGEEAFEYAEQLIKSGEIGLIVFDSTSGMIPKSQFESDPGNFHVGKHALLFAKEIPKLNTLLSTNNVACIFISQVREKIGVMFGCFSYNNLIHLSNGATEKIGKIVNQRLPLEVKTFNFEKNIIENKKIINWYDNGNTDKYLQITSKRFDNDGKNFIEVTPNHIIITPNGEKLAGNLKEGDIIYTKGLKIYNNKQYQVALGSILGDGSLRSTSGLGGNIQLRIGHGKNQIDYCKRKENIFNSIKSWSGFNSKKGWSFDIIPSQDLNKLYEESYLNKKRRVSETLIKDINLEGIAIWFMDDASFQGSYKKHGKGKTVISVKSYDISEVKKFHKIFEKLNIPIPEYDEKYKRFTWYGEKSYLFHSLLSPYLFTEMKHKLHPKLHLNLEKNLKEDLTVKEEVILIETPIISIKNVSKKGKKFDIEVEDNHNYFCGGILVHNSPEITPAGNTLKFFASNRIELRKALKKEGDRIIGTDSKFKVVKCKTNSPYSIGILPIRFGIGIDKYEEILTLAKECEVIKVWGSVVTVFNDTEEPLKIKLEEFFALLKDNEEFFNDIKDKINVKYTLEQEVD